LKVYNEFESFSYSEIKVRITHILGSFLRLVFTRSEKV